MSANSRLLVFENDFEAAISFAQLRITDRSSDIQHVAVGESVRQLFRVVNHGKETVTNIEFSVRDSARLLTTDDLSAVSSLGSCEVRAGKWTTIFCTFAALPPDSATTVRIQITPHAEGLIQFNGQIVSSEVDLSPSDNQITKEIIVTP